MSKQENVRVQRRLYRLRGSSLGPGPTNLSKATDDELIELLQHPNKWQRFTAVRLLGERAADSTRTKLISLAKANDDGALEALWASAHPSSPWPKSEEAKIRWIAGHAQARDLVADVLRLGEAVVREGTAAVTSAPAVALPR